MKVGFYLSEGKTTLGYVLADMMVRSVRECMPGVEVVQFTDHKSSGLYGVDKLSRREGNNIMRLRLEHYSTPGEWLFIDIDALMQKDVREVFESDFDIAITDREGSLLPAEVGSPFMARMPYNLGVVFSRKPEFWQEALKRFERFPRDYQNDVTADQQAVCDTIKESAFNVKILPGVPYNISPRTADQDLSYASIIHYKGQRKFWMLNRLYKELGLAA